MNAIKIMVKGWVKVLPFCLFAILPLLVSCSEEDDAVEEFADWQTKNDTYFEQKYQEYFAAQSATKFVLKNWSQPEDLSVGEVAHEACILVDVIGSGTETGSPLYTDVVSLHYTGRLIPSPNYPNGYQFDSSFFGDFDPMVSHPTELSVNGVVAGFATALQHMHRGDHWRVTIPYQLGYGTTTQTSVPAYSTLIFEIWLDDFWSEDAGV